MAREQDPDFGFDGRDERPADDHACEAPYEEWIHQRHAEATCYQRTHCRRHRGLDLEPTLRPSRLEYSVDGQTLVRGEGDKILIGKIARHKRRPVTQTMTDGQDADIG